MLSSMLVFFGPGTAAQIVLAIFLCLVAIKVYSYYEPFVEDSDDHLAEAAQWVLFSCLFAALLIQANVTDDDPEAQHQLGILLLALSVIPFVYVVGCLVAELAELCSIGASEDSLNIELSQIYGSEIQEEEADVEVEEIHDGKAFVMENPMMGKPLVTNSIVETQRVKDQPAVHKPAGDKSAEDKPVAEAGIEATYWTAHHSEEHGRHYYVNLHTGESAWELPSGAVQKTYNAGEFDDL